MKTRITQLVSRLLATLFVYLAVKMGATEDQQQTAMQFASEISLWVTAVLWFAFDIAIHRIETGSIFSPAGKSKRGKAFTFRPTISSKSRRKPQRKSKRKPQRKETHK